MLRLLVFCNLLWGWLRSSASFWPKFCALCCIHCCLGCLFFEALFQMVRRVCATNSAQLLRHYLNPFCPAFNFVFTGSAAIWNTRACRTDASGIKEDDTGLISRSPGKPGVWATFACSRLVLQVVPLGFVKLCHFPKLWRVLNFRTILQMQMCRLKTTKGP